MNTTVSMSRLLVTPTDTLFAANYSNVINEWSSYRRVVLAISYRIRVDIQNTGRNCDPSSGNAEMQAYLYWSSMESRQYPTKAVVVEMTTDLGVQSL